MKHIMQMKAKDCLVVLVDYQEKLMPVMAECEALEEKTLRFVKGVQALGLPILVTQQYTKGLGMTIASIRECIEDFQYIEKKSFSALGSQDFIEKLCSSGKKTILLCGIESHICVMQTALDLLDKGYKVFVVSDCCASRNPYDSEIGLARIEKSGGLLTTMESTLMELIRGAEHPEFKTISKIIK